MDWGVINELSKPAGMPAMEGLVMPVLVKPNMSAGSSEAGSVSPSEPILSNGMIVLGGGQKSAPLLPHSLFKAQALRL